MWYENKLTKLLNINYPIIQAPMAGGFTTSELVAEVSNNGGLGMIGAGYMDEAELKKAIKEVKSLTDKPFGVNLFALEEIHVSSEEITNANQLLTSFKKELNIPEEVIQPTFNSLLNEQIKVILDEKVAICSFTFGIPSTKAITMLKENGVLLIGTATTVKEAIQNEEAGMDIVVVQGSEAGGHRGAFLEISAQPIGTVALIPQVVDHVNIPVIAAGGMMDGRGIIAANALGAMGVQMGTAFLTCKESGAHPLHKKAILSAAETAPVLTKAFSGKSARGIHNPFIEEMKQHEEILPPYPIQNALTKPIRKAAKEQNRTEFMSLWSGQGTRLSKDLTVKQFMEGLISDASNTMDRMKQ